MMLSRNARFLGLAAVTALLVGIVLFTGPCDRSTMSKIGVIVARTGPASFIGGPEAKVIEELLKQPPYATATKNVANIPGFGEIEFEIRDSGGNLDQAEAIFREFAADPRVIAVIGPSTSGESIRLARIAKDVKMTLLSLAASRSIVQDPDNPSKVNAWTFKFAQNDDLAAKRLFSAMIADGVKRVALLTSEDGFGKSGATVVDEVDKNTPQVEVAFKRTYSTEIARPESVIAPIPNDIDAVLIWGTSPGPALLVPAVRNAFPQARIYLSHGNASVDFAQQVGPSGEDATIVGSRVLLPIASPQSDRDSVIAQFQNFWSSRFSSSPSHFAGHARDALMISTICLPKVGKIEAKREAFRGAVESLGKFEGVTGSFHFSEEDHAGLDASAFETYSIKNSGFLLIEKQ